VEGAGGIFRRPSVLGFLGGVVGGEIRGGTTGTGGSSEICTLVV